MFTDEGNSIDDAAKDPVEPNYTYYEVQILLQCAIIKACETFVFNSFMNPKGLFFSIPILFVFQIMEKRTLSRHGVLYHGDVMKMPSGRVVRTKMLNWNFNYVGISHLKFSMSDDWINNCSGIWIYPSWLKILPRINNYSLKIKLYFNEHLMLG